MLLGFLISFHQFLHDNKKMMKNNKFLDLHWETLILEHFPLFFAHRGKKFLFGKTFGGVWCEKKDLTKAALSQDFYQLQCMYSSPEAAHPMNVIQWTSSEIYCANPECASYAPWFWMKGPSWWNSSRCSLVSVHSLQQKQKRFTVNTSFCCRRTVIDSF